MKLAIAISIVDYISYLTFAKLLIIYLSFSYEISIEISKFAFENEILYKSIFKCNESICVKRRT